MKILAVIAVLALTAVAASANITDPKCNGVVHGVALNEDSQPVPRVGLMLLPLGVDLAYVLPTTTTNEAGLYRFENVCPGRFTVVVEDERAGYPSYVWAAYFLSETKLQEVVLVPGGAEVELPVPVPPKAGVLDLRVRNRRTGDEITNVQVILKPQHSNHDWITFNSDAGMLLVPSNTDLLLRLKSDGFRQWKEAANKGTPIRLQPSAHLTVEAELEPQ
jgi:hypothetical protein